ncbi:response regulator [Flavisolibacter sp. BT320]|nr:response regulator [Flavisolibacter longurius]
MQIDRHAITRILLIDDDDDDHIVFKLAMAEVDDSIQLLYSNCADNITDLIALEKPQLIFLDINLPRINGIECLEQLQKDKLAKTIPVVMYSSSELPRDLQLSFGAGASLYFQKPTELSKLISALKKIFAMDWEQPGTIREKHLMDGRYMAFATNENR